MKEYLFKWLKEDKLALEAGIGLTAVLYRSLLYSRFGTRENFNRTVFGWRRGWRMMFGDV